MFVGPNALPLQIQYGQRFLIVLPRVHLTLCDHDDFTFVNRAFAFSEKTRTKLAGVDVMESC